jgi:hypothetical protein
LIALTIAVAIGASTVNQLIAPEVYDDGVKAEMLAVQMCSGCCRLTPAPSPCCARSVDGSGLSVWPSSQLRAQCGRLHDRGHHVGRQQLRHGWLEHELERLVVQRMAALGRLGRVGVVG